MNTAQRPPRFGVSQFTHWHQTFEQDVELYKRAKVDTIELCERKLSRDPAKARDQLRMLKDSGLPVSSVQPRVHALFVDFMCPDILDPELRHAEYRKTIDLIGEFFPGVPMVTISGNPPKQNYREAHATARRLYPKLADYAADRGVRVMFEPLNPVLMNCDSFICSLDEAVRLIEDVDRPNFGLMLDVWHVWHEPHIAERIAKLPRSMIHGVHISDWPREQPRTPADRVLPGDGIIDLPALFGAIEATGYDDAYALEIFSADDLPDSLWKQDPLDVIERGRRGFLRAWEKRTREGAAVSP